VNKAQRIVSVFGEVNRVGQYQLLEGENISTLINYYGDGFTKLSDNSRILVQRKTEIAKATIAIYIDYLNEENFILKDLDEVVIKSKLELRPILYIEGAIGSDNESIVLDAANKFPYYFSEGERLYNVMQSFKKAITSVSDLKNAYVIRMNVVNPIPVNLEKLLYQYSFVDDIILMPLDRVIIPFKQYFITIGGAVMKPGRYPYIPDRSSKYYINLAGGIDPERNANNVVEILDIDDNKKASDVPIMPEDKIIVPTNNPMYHMQKIANVIIPVITLATSVVTLIQIFQGN